jgi:hypothetical protein
LPPAALRQGIAREAVDHEVAVVDVVGLVATHGPQTGNRAGRLSTM